MKIYVLFILNMRVDFFLHISGALNGEKIDKRVVREM